MNRATRLASLAGLALSLSAASFASAQSYTDKARDAAKSEAKQAVKDEVNKATAKGDIVDVAVANGNFKTLAAALQAAGLVETLKGKGPFTVFAPTDAAFAKLPAGTVEALLNDKAALTAILTYHVVPGNVAAKQVVGLKNAVTVNGQRVDIAVNGNTVTIDKATVTTADVAASNGVIHVIDTVLLPESKNAVEVAGAAGSFKTLLTAAEKAGLVDALKAGPITIFAPTDEAFSKLPAGTVENLIKPENKEALANILKYHVVSGRVYSDSAIKAGTAKTLQGGGLTIKTDGKAVTINNATVTTADIESSNAVIHVIDTVLLPK